MKYLIIATVMLLVSACEAKPEKPQTQAQAAAAARERYSVRRIFEIDGCTVYYFRDGGSHYFTSCRGTTTNTYRSGKVTHEEEITTQ